MNYQEFLKQKMAISVSCGFDINTSDLNKNLFEWQKLVVKWALKKGKCALFEDCGLGKTIQQLAWASEVVNKTAGNVLIVAPLAVTSQTKEEGKRFGVNVNVCRTQNDISYGINITNYEMLENFDPGEFVGVVLDESSILKNSSGTTRTQIIDMFKHTPYKLACTATPSPNDFMELGNHSEFLGVMTQTEMLSTFFVHDGGDTSKWRLKGHAQDKFWEWISSWAFVLQNPKQLGFNIDGYDLPTLNIIEHVVKSENIEDDNGQIMMCAEIKQTLNERRNARKESLENRVKRACEIASGIDGQVLVWCDLNVESEMLKRGINGAVEVKGSDTAEHKTNSMMNFSKSELRCLVSKSSICGWGMNWQQCNNMIFVGLSDSFEAYYQAVRRCWRFGQKNNVNVHIVISDAEGAVKANIERKQHDAQLMMDELSKHTKDILIGDITNTVRISEVYNANQKMVIPNWIRSETA